MKRFAPQFSLKWLLLAMFVGGPALAVATPYAARWWRHMTEPPVTVGGQLLPSGYYISTDVQYFAPGPEFKLSREAATMKAFNAEVVLENPPAPPADKPPADSAPGNAPVDEPADSVAK